MKKSIWFGLILLRVEAICLAQIPVSQEPMHHKVLDNSHVRLLDVHIAAGDTTRFHIHATPSIFLVLTEAKTGAEIVSEEDRTANPIQHYGNMWFEGFYSKPRIHRVYNSDRHEFRVMDIELTNKNIIDIDPAIEQEAFSLVFEEIQVRAYRLKLLPGAMVSLEPRKADIIMILLSDSALNTFVNKTPSGATRANEKSLRRKGDFQYINSGNALKIENGGMSAAEFAFFELK